MSVLHWLDRNKTLATTPKVPCRILRVDEGLSCGDADSGNLLIQGDNLHALKALLPYFRDAVKCVFNLSGFQELLWICADSYKQTVGGDADGVTAIQPSPLRCKLKRVRAGAE